MRKVTPKLQKLAMLEIMLGLVLIALVWPLSNIRFFSTVILGAIFSVVYHHRMKEGDEIARKEATGCEEEN